MNSSVDAESSPTKGKLRSGGTAVGGLGGVDSGGAEDKTGVMMSPAATSTKGKKRATGRGGGGAAPTRTTPSRAAKTKAAAGKDGKRVFEA